MISLGIMQGRLTETKGRGIQFFPFDNWENEFREGKKIGIQEIEWIFDFDRYEENPLWTIEGVERINDLIEETGIKVRSVCFDYFMRRPFYKESLDRKNDMRQENFEFAKKVLSNMEKIGATLLEVPMVDNSSIQNEKEEREAISFLRDVLEFASSLELKIGCETDMPVGKFRDFLDKVDHTNIYANYDSGNSSGLGYDHAAEIKSLSNYIYNVHIKDRKLHGTTMQLGTGSADFDAVFSSLKNVGYDESILLQAARGNDGDEVNNIISQLKFVKDYCKKYEIEV